MDFEEQLDPSAAAPADVLHLLKKSSNPRLEIAGSKEKCIRSPINYSFLSTRSSRSNSPPQTKVIVWKE